ncbi:hypothetical protein NDI56_03910 [Haloarcula sp. S1CR25-12]|uniref:Uncharacterized protein n=1 Tax=Haloarcula saliterrae TaxID=2950534 RepID=A0ABU2F9R9_9EURY|nr:hypothetical protein [Haloarcula sp. S1CR25-12]MDS0258556.1 hypothetical protein [Haloarcula sp. S1CR25-12]
MERPGSDDLDVDMLVDDRAAVKLTLGILAERLLALCVVGLLSLVEQFAIRMVAV